jgi:hypothetical protein
MTNSTVYQTYQNVYLALYSRHKRQYIEQVKLDKAKAWYLYRSIIIIKLTTSAQVRRPRVTLRTKSSCSVVRIINNIISMMLDFHIVKRVLQLDSPQWLLNQLQMFLVQPAIWLNVTENVFVTKRSKCWFCYDLCMKSIRCPDMANSQGSGPVVHISGISPAYVIWSQWFAGCGRQSTSSDKKYDSFCLLVVQCIL